MSRIDLADRHLPGVKAYYPPLVTTPTNDGCYCVTAHRSMAEFRLGRIPA